MNARNIAGRLQRGFMGIVAAILLVAGVLFVLTQSLGLVGSRSVDVSRDLDAAAALMLAESALQRAQFTVTGAASSGVLTNTNCTQFSGTGPISLGRGTFSYGTAVSFPATCSATGNTPCGSCTFTVSGTVGSTVRTVSQLFNFSSVNGVAGNGQTVTMSLANGTNTVPAMALFNLAFQRQGTGGNAEASICTNGATGCSNRWNLVSGNGNNAVGGMGVSVDIAPLATSKIISQYISQPRSYAEVGALFPSTSATVTPTVVSSYWNDASQNGGTVGGNNDTTGTTNSGVASTSTATCVASPNVYGSGSSQTCTSWCYDADTLVFGVSGRSASTADEIRTVTFNTAGSLPQNVTMSRVVHFPNIGISGASGRVFSEVWWAHNLRYESSATGVGARSHTPVAQVMAGAAINLNANISNNGTSMVVASYVHPNSRICVGDGFSSPTALAGLTVTAVAGGGTCTGSTGTFTLSSPGAASTVNKNNTIPTTKSTTLTVFVSSGSFSTGTLATPNGNVNIASGPNGSGNYVLSAAAYVAPAYGTQGSSSSTIQVPAGTALPAVGTRVAIYQTSVSGFTGQGSIPANTTVTAVGVDSFTLSAAPTVGLAGVTLCGGICAFFNTPGSTSSSTTFTIGKSAGTAQWAGGFMCMRGVDKALVTPVSSSSTTAGDWREPVQ